MRILTDAEISQVTGGQRYGSGGNPAHGEKNGQGTGGGYFENNKGHGQGPVNNPHFDIFGSGNGGPGEDL